MVKLFHKDKLKDNMILRDRYGNIFVYSQGFLYRQNDVDRLTLDTDKYPIKEYNYNLVHDQAELRIIGVDIATGTDWTHVAYVDSRGRLLEYGRLKPNENIFTRDDLENGMILKDGNGSILAHAFGSLCIQEDIDAMKYNTDSYSLEEYDTYLNHGVKDQFDDRNIQSVHIKKGNDLIQIAHRGLYGRLEYSSHARQNKNHLRLLELGWKPLFIEQHILSYCDGEVTINLYLKAKTFLIEGDTETALSLSAEVVGIISDLFETLSSGSIDLGSFEKIVTEKIISNE